KYWRSEASPVRGTTRASPRADALSSRKRLTRFGIPVSVIMDTRPTSEWRYEQLAGRRLADEHRAAVVRSRRDEHAVGHDALIDRRAGANRDVVPKNRTRHARRSIQVHPRAGHSLAEPLST